MSDHDDATTPSSRVLPPTAPTILDTYTLQLEEQVVHHRARAWFWEKLAWSVMILAAGALVVILMLVTGRG